MVSDSGKVVSNNDKEANMEVENRRMEKAKTARAKVKAKTAKASRGLHPSTVPATIAASLDTES